MIKKICFLFVLLNVFIEAELIPVNFNQYLIGRYAITVDNNDIIHFFYVDYNYLLYNENRDNINGIIKYSYYNGYSWSEPITIIDKITKSSSIIYTGKMKTVADNDNNLYFYYCNSDIFDNKEYLICYKRINNIWLSDTIVESSNNFLSIYDIKNHGDSLFIFMHSIYGNYLYIYNIKNYEYSEAIKISEQGYLSLVGNNIFSVDNWGKNHIYNLMIIRTTDFGNTFDTTYMKDSDSLYKKSQFTIAKDRENIYHMFYTQNSFTDMERFYSEDIPAEGPTIVKEYLSFDSGYTWDPIDDTIFYMPCHDTVGNNIYIPIRRIKKICPFNNSTSFYLTFLFMSVRGYENQLKLYKFDSNSLRWEFIKNIHEGTTAETYTVMVKNNFLYFYHFDQTAYIYDDLWYGLIYKYNIENGFDCNTKLEENDIGDFIEQKVVLYPNPTKNYINIKLGNLFFSKIELYDLTGRNIFTRVLNYSDKLVRINLKYYNISTGMYILKLTSHDKSVNKKFLYIK